MASRDFAVLNVQNDDDELQFQDFGTGSSSQTHVFTDVPDSPGHQDTDKLLGEYNDPDEQTSKQDKKEHSIWSFGYYQKLFDVDSKQVGERIIWSMFPKPGVSYLDLHIRPKPDLYGPFWVCLTLVFAAAIAGNMSNYLQTQGSHAMYWRYDFHKVSLAAGMVFSYAWLLPLVLYSILRYQSSKPSLALLDLVCLYGYSMSVLVPVCMMWTVPIVWLRWCVGIVGVVLSGVVLTKAVWEGLKGTGDEVVDESGGEGGGEAAEGGIMKKLAMVMVLAVAAMHVAIAMAFMFYFFSEPGGIRQELLVPLSTSGPTMLANNIHVTAMPDIGVIKDSVPTKRDLGLNHNSSKLPYVGHVSVAANSVYGYGAVDNGNVVHNGRDDTGNVVQGSYNSGVDNGNVVQGSYKGVDTGNVMHGSNGGNVVPVSYNSVGRPAMPGSYGGVVVDTGNVVQGSYNGVGGDGHRVMQGSYGGNVVPGSYRGNGMQGGAVAAGGVVVDPGNAVHSDGGMRAPQQYAGTGVLVGNSLASGAVVGDGSKQEKVMLGNGNFQAAGAMRQDYRNRVQSANLLADGNVEDSSSSEDLSNVPQSMALRSANKSNPKAVADGDNNSSSNKLPSEEKVLSENSIQTKVQKVNSSHTTGTNNITTAPSTTDVRKNVHSSRSLVPTSQMAKTETAAASGSVGATAASGPSPANTADIVSVKANTASVKANTATVKANTASVIANTASVIANTASVKENAASEKENAVSVKSDATSGKADATFVKADATSVKADAASDSNVADEASSITIPPSSAQQPHDRQVKVRRNVQVLS